MLKYTGKKGEAKLSHSSKKSKAKERLAKLPFINKEIMAAVYADGKIYNISGCSGLEKAMPDSIRILGKKGNMYNVIWGSSKSTMMIGREELAEKIEKCFDTKCTSCKGTQNHSEELVSEER